VRIPPSVRKLGLLIHVITSVGWLGAVAVFLALSIVGVTADDEQLVRGSYRLMDVTARYTLVPLAFASLLTGVIQSLITQWGLFKHYWVVIKLLLTAFSTAILLVYLRTFALMAAAAGDHSLELAAVRNPSPILHSVLALVVLGAATILAIFKPTGLTRYGWRRRLRLTAPDSAT
jgi:hypothetical protein